MTRLILVRHGETEWHADNRYAGISDVALTPRGLDQARALAAWAGTARPDAVWCSDLSRSRLTAAPSAAAIGARLHVDERLRELDFGHGEGLTRAEMERKFPEELRAFLADPVAAHLPGGEDPAAAARRFTACLDDIARLHEGGRVLVVGHSTAIRLALCRLLGMPLKDYRRRFPSLGNCALTEIRLRDGEAALLEFNTPLER
ncbi:putative phosphoglycerate mutase [Actinomadura coerulea]|uniref:Putative phosphoglycerate mutase n=1 Tax=Actinomadura coerulea TaxID=46159 RepID=A0A7X0KYF6_9ACTN|nr:histidine phosphatase family protein [Actinomadura coerulea]MBB6395357.1 putative phosphoglycerate mutase [Actinomadura coerulea]GGQ43738.1 alpha-ribazole phosphatase [Actinomadura coerulea]